MRRVRLSLILLTAFALLFASSPILAGGSADVVGTWNLEFDEEGTAVRPKLTLQEQDGKLSGEWSGPRGTAPLTDAKYESGVLTFSLVQHAVFRNVTVQFSAQVADGKLNGTLKARRGETPVTGVRAP